MIQQEMKKTWNLPMVLLACLICLFTAVSAANAGRWDWNVEDDQVYRAYLERWKGDLTEEKLAQIQEERILLRTIPAMEQEMKEAYANQEITWEEYCAYTEQLYYVQTHQGGFEQLEMDLAYLENETVETGLNHLQLLYDRYWNYFFQADTVDYVLLFLVVAVALRSFFVETSSRMLPMLKASSEGNAGVMSAKFLAVGLSAGGVTLLCGLIRLVFFLLCRDTPCAGGALQSLHMFASVSWPISIWAGALVMCVLRMIGFAILGMLVVALSLLTGREVIAAVVSLVCVFLPYMVRGKAAWLYEGSLYGLMNGVITMLGAAAYSSNGLVQAGIVLGVCAAWGLVALSVMKVSVKK